MKSYIVRNLIFGSLLFPISGVNAQGENNRWYFGNYAGLHFTPAGPIALTDGVAFAHDGTASVSTADGNLLFYSNGENIWNKNHVVMANGNGLLGSHTSTHSAVIVPKPGVTSEYYVFTADRGGFSNGLRYHIVDMSLQGGLGEVTSKNTLLAGPVTEKLISVRHSNGQDVWLIAHGSGDNVFQAYLLTAAGLSTTPVVSAVGFVQGTGELNARGQLKSSPDGNKLALAISGSHRYEVFDFNAYTGQVSNPIEIQNEANAYGVEFSPNSRYLYTVRLGAGIINQFDLQAGGQSDIVASKVAIGTATVPASGNQYKVACLQLGPDNKIYVTKWDSPYLAVVSSPDLPGIQSNFVDNGVFLGGRTSFGGLSVPVLPNVKTTSAADPVSQNFRVFPNPAKGVVTISLADGFKLQNEAGIVIANMLGQTVFTSEIANTETNLNINQLPAGVYQVRVSTDNAARAVKLVVQ